MQKGCNGTEVSKIHVFEAHTHIKLGKGTTVVEQRETIPGGDSKFEL